MSEKDKSVEDNTLDEELSLNESEEVRLLYYGALSTILKIKSDKKAIEINFPTGNMIPNQHILPKRGVYCVEVLLEGKKYKGVSNFGLRPTVDGSKLLLETHMFNFSEEIYGKELTVEFLTFIRSEQKFNNFEELTKQINKDIIKAKEYHQL